MTNAQRTTGFLAAIDPATRGDILVAIAAHYGCSPAQALEEVTDPEAEHLLDYLTGATRAATSTLMQRHGLRYTSQGVPA